MANSGTVTSPPAYWIRNARTGIVLPKRGNGPAFLTFATTRDAEAWIAAQKPDLPYEDFEVVEADGDE